MAIEITLALIKPDAVEAKNVGKIFSIIEKSSLQIVAIKTVHLSKEEGEKFYAVHSDKPFYDSLTDFISSTPIFAIALKGENATLSWRKIMGVTNFKEADEGTIRKLFATSINDNCVHGSDSQESADLELPQFFSQREYL